MSEKKTEVEHRHSTEAKAKLKVLQKEVPFLKSSIDYLKKENGIKSVALLAKVKATLKALTDKNAKLKMEHLISFEVTVELLHLKMNARKHESRNSQRKSPVYKESFETCGPASPPPQSPKNDIQPLEIPTERKTSPIELHERSSRKKLRDDSDINKISSSENPYSRRPYERTHKKHDKHYIHESDRGYSHRERESGHRHSHHEREYDRRRSHKEKETDRKHSHHERQYDRSRDYHNRESSSHHSKSETRKFDNSSYKAIHSRSRSNSYSSDDQVDEVDSIVYKFKIPQKSSVFQRLGDPLQNNKPESNLLNVPKISDVLKSPPLTPNDISNLLDETDIIYPPPHISEIGTRRAKKPSASPSTESTVSNLDLVRKKFAMITQNSTPNLSPHRIANNVINERSTFIYNPQLRDDKPYSNYSKDPHETSLSPSNLVRNRNMRSNSPDMSYNKTSPKNQQQLMNFNVLPSINTNDPRVRKSLSNTSVVGGLQCGFPAAMNLPQVNLDTYGTQQMCLGPITQPKSMQMVNDSFYMSSLSGNSINSLPMFNNQLSSTNFQSISPTLNPNKNLNSFQQYNSNENWGSAPELTKNTNKNNGNSSEEDWDLDEEIPTKETNKSWSNAAPIALANMNIRRPNETLAIPSKPPFTPPIIPPIIPPLMSKEIIISPNYAMQKNQFCDKNKIFSNVSNDNTNTSKTTSKFSAVLNDKRERIKYFESKKHKFSEPRTYPEFRQAKARALAEEAARKTADSQLPKSTENINEKQVQESAKNKAEVALETKENETKEKETKDSVVAKLTPPSSLDKLYRNLNSNVESKFLKSTCNFKIPKKLSPVKKDEDCDKVKTAKNEEQSVQTKSSNGSENPTKIEKDAVFESVKLKGENIKVDNKVENKAEIKIENEIIPKTKAPIILNTKPSSIKMNDDTVSIKNVLKRQTFLKNHATDIEAKTKLFDLKVSSTPCRIKERRSTMCSEASTPIVDKEELLSTSALVYEDIDNKNKIEQKNVKTRKFRNVIDELFQKTDDNCTVSTQNIIDGKRSRRTIVNFNEVQQTAAIFKHRKTESSKNENENVEKTNKSKANSGNNDKTNNKAKATTKKKSIAKNENQEQQQQQKPEQPTTSAAAAAKDNKKSTQSNEKKSKDATNRDDINAPTEVLTKFITDVLKPEANTKELYEKLSKDMNDKICQIAKSVLEVIIKKKNENENKELIEDETLNKTNENSVKSNEEQKGTNKKKPKKRNQTNLSEDIRDMLISKVVMSADESNDTTLATKASKMVTKPETTKGNNNNNKESDCIKTNPQYRIRKSKVVLNQLNVSLLRRSKRVNIADSDANDSVNSSDLNIQSVFEKNENEKKAKAGIKTDKNEADNENENDNENESEKSTKTVEENVELTAVDKTSTDKTVAVVAIADNNQSDDTNQDKNIVIKNTNKNWHVLSEFAKMCLICESKIPFPATHYKSFHKESYIARFAPNVLEEFKAGKGSKPMYANYVKKMLYYAYRCPFCLIQNQTSPSGWIEHFITHTGEYPFQCSKCLKCASKSMCIEKHIKQSCSGATNLYSALPRGLKRLEAYICDLCDFVQMKRENLDKHFVEQHDIDATETNKMGYSIELFNIEGVDIKQDIKSVKSIDDNIKKATQNNKSEENSENGKNETEKDNENANTNVNEMSKETEKDKDKIDDDEDNKKVKESKNENNKEKERKRGTVKEAKENKANISAKNKNKPSNVVNTAQEVPANKSKQSLDAANANVFMPTKDTGDNYCTIASGIFKINENNETIANITVNDTPTIVNKSNMSMAERLSQRIRSMQEQAAVNAANNEVSADLTDSTGNCANENQEPNQSIEPIEYVSTTGIDQPIGFQSEIIDVDDENWEDIEILDPPNTSTSITTTSVKDNKNKGKNIFYKFSKFHTMKKKASISNLAVKKKQFEMATDKIWKNDIELNNSNSNSNLMDAIAEERSALRTMLANLGAPGPDSPDPIDLVPELAPLEPLQDLNDISSLLGQNFVSLENELTIQEALDYVKEEKQKQINSENYENKNSPANVNRIQNIGFHLKDNNKFMFHCLLKSCTFLFSNEVIGLENHYLCEHSQIKWNGYCECCQRQVEGTTENEENHFSISLEIQHMLEEHANDTASLKRKSEIPEEKPRLKIRRFSGDWITKSCANKKLGLVETNSAINKQQCENTDLSKLLKAQPRPPTKPMPPQVPMPITDPLFLSDADIQLFNKMDNSDISVAFQNRLESEESAESVHSSSDCSLQIASVRSLNNMAFEATSNQKDLFENVCDTSNNEESISLPKISNVCSLNSLWDKESQGRFIEREKSSVELAKIKPETNPKSTFTSINDNEPIVVAETLPLGQAQTGDFLITQTISAQYDQMLGDGNSEAQLGLNISISNSNSNNARTTALDETNDNQTEESSIVSDASPLPLQFKCMVSGCKYQTYFAHTMQSHLQFHQSQSFLNQNEILRCGYCNYLGINIDALVKHTENEHLLNQSISETNSSEVLNEEENVTIPQLSELNSDSFSKKSYHEQLSECIADIVQKTGIPDDQVYKCVAIGCKERLNAFNYQNHVINHLCENGIYNTMNHNFKCPHCSVVHHKITLFKSHLKTHEHHRYFCYICMETAGSADLINKHFCEKHWRTVNMNTAVLFKISSTNSYYVANSKHLNFMEVKRFGEKLIWEWQRKKAESKKYFQPSEISLLPMPSIFKTEVFCSSCHYKTKVRKNMLRHLQMHLSSTTDESSSQQMCVVDPVNPVPCLNSNEKHFDRMTNLASSSVIINTNSNKSNNKPKYEFIPDAIRFTCGVDDCEYITVSDDIFRSHLNALHINLFYYQCPHCKEEICKRGISVDRIIQHLRFHASKIYKCETCNYLHYMRNVVERHINDKHPTMIVNLLIYDRFGGEQEDIITKKSVKGKKYKEPSLSPSITTTTTADDDASNLSAEQISELATAGQPKSKASKWVCDICEYKAGSQQQISAHCQAIHGCKYQYQCVHCKIGASKLTIIMTHIDERHPGKMREARTLFRRHQQIVIKTWNTLDTQPLWTRDDPKRIRHIRGILMEDEDESENYSKRLRLDDDYDETTYSNNSISPDSNSAKNAEVINSTQRSDE